MPDDLLWLSDAVVRARSNNSFVIRLGDGFIVHFNMDCFSNSPRREKWFIKRV